MPSLTYSVPTPPSNMSLKARLAYAYLFYEDSDWHCVKTTTDHWIIVIGNNLNDAEIWDNGSTLNVAYPVDRVEIISTPKGVQQRAEGRHSEAESSETKSKHTGM